MEQVKGEVGEIDFCAFLESCLEIRETRAAFLIDDDHLSIEDSALHRDLFGSAD